jgi:hypothetical protein
VVTKFTQSYWVCPSTSPRWFMSLPDAKQTDGEQVASNDCQTCLQLIYCNEN